MTMTQTTEHSYKSPIRKLLPFFQRSRDGWKDKHHAVKAQLKKEQNQARAVEKSRAAWREKAEAAERRVKELERQVAELKSSAAAPG